MILILLVLAGLTGIGFLGYKYFPGRNESEPVIAVTPSPSPEITAETVTVTPKPPIDWSVEPAQPAEPEPVVDEYTFHSEYRPRKYTSAVNQNENFQTGWTLETNEGASSFDTSWNSMDFEISDVGSSYSGLRLYRGGIPFRAGSTVTISFTASSHISRQILLTMVDGGSGQVLFEKKVPAGFRNPEKSYSFEAPYNVSNAYLNIYLGNDGNRDTINEHDIHIENLRVSSSSAYRGAVIDQVGYLSYGQKRCTFPYDAGDLFDVIDQDGNIVYTGSIQDKSFDEYTGEHDCYGDFTPVTEPGTYFIRTQIGVVSSSFVIAEDPYTALRDDALRMLTMQRCGMTLDEWWAHDMAHEECHTEEAVIYETDTHLDVSGGWHDAGDYGRYTETGAKAVDDLLMAYLANPDLWTDTCSIPESLNDIPDILDEARYELEWMLKMQSEDGSVYNTVIPENISEIVVPEEDDQELILLFRETTSTADFAGTMALANIAYRDYDPSFAGKCLNAAKRADEYLTYNPRVTDHPNPEGVNGGSYKDSTDTDARFFTKIALWAATFKDEYLAAAKEIYASNNNCVHGISWNSNGGYGRYLFLSAKDADRIDPEFYQEMKNSLIYEADIIMDTVLNNSYNCSLSAYGWGSNADALNNGVILSMAFDVTGEQVYQQAAVEQLHYVLGKNSLNICFVTGYGTNTPSDIHSRIAKAKGASLKGALAGGPDSWREDNLTQKMPEDTPQAKMYIDNFDSWSTNEITVYYNSALLHILGRVCR